jgi:hypothetical protein
MEEALNPTIAIQVVVEIKFESLLYAVSLGSRVKDKGAQVSPSHVLLVKTFASALTIRHATMSEVPIR